MCVPLLPESLLCNPHNSTIEVMHVAGRERGRKISQSSQRNVALSMTPRMYTGEVGKSKVAGSSESTPGLKSPDWTWVSVLTLMATGLQGGCWAEWPKTRQVKFCPRFNKSCQTAPSSASYDPLLPKPTVTQVHNHFQHCPLRLSRCASRLPKSNGIYYGIGFAYVKRTWL